MAPPVRVLLAPVQVNVVPVSTLMVPLDMVTLLAVVSVRRLTVPPVTLRPPLKAIGVPLLPTVNVPPDTTILNAVVRLFTMVVVVRLIWGVVPTLGIVTSNWIPFGTVPPPQLFALFQVIPSPPVVVPVQVALVVGVAVRVRAVPL